MGVRGEGRQMTQEARLFPSFDARYGRSSAFRAKVYENISTFVMWSQGGGWSATWQRIMGQSFLGAWGAGMNEKRPLFKTKGPCSELNRLHLGESFLTIWTFLWYIESKQEKKIFPLLTLYGTRVTWPNSAGCRVLSRETYGTNRNDLSSMNHYWQVHIWQENLL